MPPSQSTERSAARRTTWVLLRGAMAGGPLFVGAFVIAGARRPGYEPQRHPISALALGPGGWVQTANFLASGALLTAGAVGWRRALGSVPAPTSVPTPGLIPAPGAPPAPGARWLPRLLATAGLGLVGAGLFATDPVPGYPPGTPVPTARWRPTRRGLLHVLSAIPVYVALPAACFAGGRWWRARGEVGRARLSVMTGAVAATALVLSMGDPRQQTWRTACSGRFQRVGIASGLAWITWFATHLCRAGGRRSAA